MSKSRDILSPSSLNSKMKLSDMKQVQKNSKTGINTRKMKKRDLRFNEIEEKLQGKLQEIKMDQSRQKEQVK